MILGCVIIVTALVQFACSGSVSSPPAPTELPPAPPTALSSPTQSSLSVAHTPTATFAPTATPAPAATARPSSTATVAVIVATPTRLPTLTPTRSNPSGPPFLKVSQLDAWAMIMAPVKYSQSPATKSLVFRVKACAACRNKVSAPEKVSDADDGNGIKNIEFIINKVDAQQNPIKEVYRRTEENKYYCAFGGGEPDCSVLVFADNPKGWPGKNEPFDGDYQLRVIVRPKQGEGIDRNDYFFSIKVKK
jgi:hypothetical protein